MMQTKIRKELDEIWKSIKNIEDFTGMSITNKKEIKKIIKEDEKKLLEEEKTLKAMESVTPEKIKDLKENTKFKSVKKYEGKKE